jgi:hypothetical protein
MKKSLPVAYMIMDSTSNSKEYIQPEKIGNQKSRRHMLILTRHMLILTLVFTVETNVYYNLYILLVASIKSRLDDIGTREKVTKLIQTC